MDRSHDRFCNRSCAALISAVVGPAASYVVARRQIRASVISNNRERWTEALRDSVAEYVALLLSVSAVKENIGQNPLKAVAAVPPTNHVVVGLGPNGRSPRKKNQGQLVSGKDMAHRHLGLTRLAHLA